MPSFLNTAIAVVLLPALAPATLACTLTATPVAFGAINPLMEQATDTVGTVTVSCPDPVSYTLSASPGQGDYNQRLMSFGEHSLAYNLYVDSDFLFIFGDGTGDSRVLNGEGTENEHAIHGLLPSQPSAYPGRYRDDIVLTVSY